MKLCLFIILISLSCTIAKLDFFLLLVNYVCSICMEFQILKCNIIQDLELQPSSRNGQNQMICMVYVV
jgi:hypothetical protein